MIDNSFFVQYRHTFYILFPIVHKCGCVKDAIIRCRKTANWTLNPVDLIKDHIAIGQPICIWGEKCNSSSLIRKGERCIHLPPPQFSLTRVKLGHHLEFPPLCANIHAKEIRSAILIRFCKDGRPRPGPL